MTPRRIRRGRHLVGPSPVERALTTIGTPADVLARHGIRVRHRMALCPLHDDKNPSLSLYRGHDGNQRWRCHGCGRGGDALDLEAALSGKDLRDLL